MPLQKADDWTFYKNAMRNMSEILTLAKRVQAIAENGLHYSEGDYDQDRYKDLEGLAASMIALITNLPLETIEVSTQDNPAGKGEGGFTLVPAGWLVRCGIYTNRSGCKRSF